MTQQLLIPLLITGTGAAMLLYGLFKRSQALSFRSTPCTPVRSLAKEERQFITGVAHSPVPITAPVSKKACVFYLEKVERNEASTSSRGRSRTRWTEVSSTAYGAFFVKDGSGSALVLPSARSLDLNKPEVTESDEVLPGMALEGAVRKAEQYIAEGENVTVLGTPRTLPELMNYVRQDGQVTLPSDLIAELLKLEKENAVLPCFFAYGAEKVSDLSYTDYLAGTESSAAMLLQLGAILAVVGGAALLYALRVF
ncbi:MAG: hypothetical protein A2X35_07430 [Elusimicrobia bacterium GWA2_61_42]|nr:MAG: hypothetical protein A2X35_07430 [Elusimicrobia bacterium GWA2_61_42]OGR75044.1 MAG: hypothetical protein A2X38_01580 [Elusimicrobia bacterium GWC2_61_25]